MPAKRDNVRSMSLGRVHGLARQEVGRDNGDVVAVVGVCRPDRGVGLVPIEPRLGSAGPHGDIHTGVDVNGRAQDLPILGVNQVTEGVALCALAAAAQMQLAGRVRRDELDQHAPAGRRRQTIAVQPQLREGRAQRHEQHLLGLEFRVGLYG